ncbi:unnamed protein product [Gemmata massiliana]|uniref:Uncharacterized protein n=1 Tax=Gemmata massiliana TaxID=1210884 RepID=A0A6P2CYP2_9BACT|nr:unnamed protein product [Gemmata massiliana]
MAEHRFREQLAQLHPASVSVSAFCGMSAFVPCPMFAWFAPSQQAQIQEIYRIAAERTREQLRPKRSRIPQFSLN